jgi:hypothetical protein
LSTCATETTTASIAREHATPTVRGAVAYGDDDVPRPADQPAPARSDPGLDLTTLAITAASSAVAAYICSKIWAPGTLASAAMTPVVVALVKEGLRKPTKVVAAAVPVATRRGVTRARDSTAPPTAAQPAVERTASTEVFDQALEEAPPPPFPPPSADAPEGPVRVYSTKSRRIRWRLAVITGLLGFVICVLLYTVPELIAGGSAARSGHSTTFFGGAKRQSGKVTTDTTPSTTTTPAQTTTTPATATTETVPTVTQTVTTPPPTTTPAPEPAAPAPATTTPAPAPDQSGGQPAPPQP